jgi:hypothetical protein
MGTAGEDAKDRVGWLADKPDRLEAYIVYPYIPVDKDYRCIRHVNVSGDVYT